MNTIPVPDNGLLAVIAGICFISFLYFGIYILSIAPRGKSNKAFFYFCEFTSLWSLCYTIYYLSTDAYTKEIMERFICMGMATFIIFLLRFIIIYTDIIKNKNLLRYILIIVWLPPLLFIYKSLSDNAIAKDIPFGFWYTSTAILIFVYNLASIIILVTFYVKTTTDRSRYRGLIPAIAGIIIIPISWPSDYIFGVHGMLNLHPFWLLLWIFVVLYAIRKYRFISITPSLINKDITENIEEGILLLDANKKIIFKNAALLNMLALKESEIIELQDIIFEKEILNKELSDLVQKDQTYSTVRINLIPRNTQKQILTDIKVKKVLDEYGDISGFLMIIARVKDLDQLKERYKISARELDVIHHVIAGSTNKEIADMLDVTESTVKTHIASIYDKLRIKNRVELLNLLSEFNILFKA